MGFFNDAANNAVPGGDMTKPLIIAAGALLLHHYFSGGGAAAPSGAAPSSAPGSSASRDDVPDSSILGGLGGLIGKLTGAGQGPAVNSWVTNGPNQPITPAQLGPAIGQPTLSDIAAKAGLSEQDLLAQLAQALPGLIDKLTPNGRLPTQAEIGRGYGR